MLPPTTNSNASLSPITLPSHAAYADIHISRLRRPPRDQRRINPLRRLLPRRNLHDPPLIEQPAMRQHLPQQPPPPLPRQHLTRQPPPSGLAHKRRYKPLLNAIVHASPLLLPPPNAPTPAPSAALPSTNRKKIPNRQRPPFPPAPLPDSTNPDSQNPPPQSPPPSRFQLLFSSSISSCTRTRPPHDRLFRSTVPAAVCSRTFVNANVVGHRTAVHCSTVTPSVFPFRSKPPPRLIPRRAHATPGAAPPAVPA